MDRWQNRVAVVTGASSGIGAAIVKDLAEAGMIVVGLARRVEGVEELRSELSFGAQPRLHAKKCDVSKESDVNDAFDWIEKTLGGIDVLVNNAGCVKHGQLVTQSTDLIRVVLDTNVMGVVYCTQRAFKSMKERNFDGHVVITNSVVGHYVPCFKQLPSYSMYPSSKYAVTAMTEVYRQEFSGLGTKIKITSVSPGVVDTEIISEAVKPLIPAILRPEDISSAVLYAIGTPPHVQIHELTIKPVGEAF